MVLSVSMCVTPCSIARKCCVGDQRWRDRHHPLPGNVDVHRPLHAVPPDLENLECRARHATHLSIEDNIPAWAVMVRRWPSARSRQASRARAYPETPLWSALLVLSLSLVTEAVDAAPRIGQDRR